MADLLKAAKDPKFREDVIRGLGETFSRGVAGVLGAPVDLTTMVMRPFGYNVPAEQVVGGSEYIGRQMEEAGLISSARRPTAEFLANVLTPDPMDVAKLAAMAVPVVGRAMREAPRDEAMRIAQANAAKPISEGGLGLPPDNTAMDRAKAMGFDVQFLHGASKTPSKKIYEDGMYLGETEPELKDFQAVIPGKGSGEGGAFFGTDSPAIARGYATQTKERTGATYPLMTRSEDLMESGFNRPVPENNISEWLNELERYNRSLDRGKSRYFREQIEKSKKEGKGGVVFRNTEDAAVDIGMTDPSDIYAITTAPVRSRFAAFDPAKRYESDLLGAADPRLLAGVAGATGAGLYGASRMQEGEERPQPRFGFRPDGTPKGEGWLGVLPLADGNLATEYSMQSQAVKAGDQMVDFPTLVPTLNQEEVNLMLSDIIPNRKPIPEPIVQKAIKHAKDRLDKGLSPFKELGE